MRIRLMVALAGLVLLLSTASQAGAQSCAAQAPGEDCGGEAGDALCVDEFGAPDPNQDCVATGEPASCTCLPRVCCNCTTASGSGGTCDVLPCTDFGALTALACVGVCFAADFFSGDACNLEVVSRERCDGGECPTTGCCTFQFCSTGESNGSCGAEEGFQNLCAETDEATCGSLHGLATFIPGGTCNSLLGGCVAPTATATSTETATATPTPSDTATPTQTRVPQGGDCETPSECATDFCVDGVCCNTACDGPGEICNQDGSVGTCTQAVAPAPPLARDTLLLALLALASVGAVALLRRRGTA